MTEEEKPLTREDVLKLIEEHGGTAEGLDLSGRNLQGIDLRGVVLDKANLESANLAQSDLQKGASLRGAHLSSARLNVARLFYANLQEADLGFAKMQGAFLIGAQLQEAYLRGADLTNATLSGANLEGATLSGAELQNTQLEYASLSNAFLYGADLSKARGLASVKWGKRYMVGEESKGHFAPAAEVYRNLKKWYSESGMYDIAGQFYYREMEVQRKVFQFGNFLDTTAKNAFELRKPILLVRAIFPKKPLPWAWSMLLNILCGYGEKPLRVVLSAIAVVFGLAGIYSASALTFPSSLYHSAVSFTALGYGLGASTADSWVRALGAFEAFIGVFLIALFLITFVRKMIR